MAVKAEDILAEIQKESARHNTLLAQSMFRSEEQHRQQMGQERDESKRSAAVEKFAKEQQGQEVQFSKKSQFYSNQISTQTDELEQQNYMALGLAHDIADKKQPENIKEIKNLTKAQLKLTDQEKIALAAKKKQDLGDAKRAFQDTQKTHQMWGQRFTEEVHEAKSVNNFLGSLKTDASLIFGKMGVITSIPGVQTILTGIKFILANLYSWFVKSKLGVFMLGLWKTMTKSYREARKARIKARLEERRKKIKEGMGPFKQGRDKKGQFTKSANKEGKTAEEIDKKGGFLWKMFRSLQVLVFVLAFKKKLAFIFKAIGTALTTVATFIGGLLGGITLVGVLIAAAVVLLIIGVIYFWDQIKTFFTETLPNLWDSFTGWIDTKWGEFTTWVSEKWDELTTLIVTKWDELWVWVGEKWDQAIGWLSESWTKAKEKIMGFGEKIAQFFSDAGQGLLLSVRSLWVAVLEGLQGAVNWVIEGLNLIPGVNIAPRDFATGLKEELEADKAAFASEKASRGQEVSDASTAAKAAGEGSRLPAAVAGKTAIANVNNVQQSRSYFASGTGSSDRYAAAAAANA